MESFDNPGQDPASGETDARDTRRESLFLGVEIMRPNAKLSGRIRNISATGALIESHVVLGMGEHVFLSFRGIDSVGATVVRKTVKGVGVRFDTEIDPSVCRLSVTANPNDPPLWSPPAMTPRFRQPLRPRR
jgi:hypothetical protein